MQMHASDLHSTGGAPPIVLRNAVCLRQDDVRRGTLVLSGGIVTSSPAPCDAWSMDLRDHLVLPGLVNAHDHLHLNAFPRLAHDAPFRNSYAWMDAFQPFMASPQVRAARAVPADVRRRHGALKNLVSGVVTVAHHDPWCASFDEPEFPLNVLRSYGWCHSLGLACCEAGRSPLQYGPGVRESFCATPGCWPWMIHLAEGTDAVAASELAELDGLGCLAENTVLVHGVGLTERDKTLILATEAGVVWCPGSNIELLGRTLDPRRLADAGRIALGTDSRISSSGDLLSELKLAAAHSDLTPRELYRLVTEAPSRLLRMPDAGGLTAGQRADLVIIADTAPDPYRSLLAMGRGDLRAVIRAGRPAIADPDFAEWFAVCGVETTPVRLDGRSKLCASELLEPAEAARLEPGLEWD
jgi:cytosine/adenosine deaminase-related metal-dependent hydrolase